MKTRTAEPTPRLHSIRAGSNHKGAYVSMDYERLLLEQRIAERARADDEQAAWLAEHGEDDDPLLVRVWWMMAGFGFALVLVWVAYQIAGWFA